VPLYEKPLKSFNLAMTLAPTIHFHLLWSRLKRARALWQTRSAAHVTMAAVGRDQTLSKPLVTAALKVEEWQMLVTSSIGLWRTASQDDEQSSFGGGMFLMQNFI
jgi:hypothetical protein